MLQTKVWYGGPGQHENLRDVEAGILRQGFLFFIGIFRQDFYLFFTLTDRIFYWPYKVLLLTVLREDSVEKEEEYMEEVKMSNVK